MRHFDHDYASRAIARLRRIPSDAKPAWGTMTPLFLITHLGLAVKYSMGHAGRGKVYGKWYLRKIIGPLIVHGILPIPKNARLPKRILEAQQKETIMDLETLHAILEEYLNLVQAGELTPEPHPFFGHIGIDGWDKFHVRHFEHHLRQFGV